MAAIVQCSICNKPFQSFSGKICQNCLRNIDDSFIKIREFLDENPSKASVDEICEGVEVDRKIVLHLLREKRLTTLAPVSGLLCQSCRRPINGGTICDDCRKKLASTLAGSIPKPVHVKKPAYKDTNKSKMHIDISNRN